MVYKELTTQQVVLQYSFGIDLLAALEQLPEASSRFRKNLPPRAHPVLAQLEIIVRQKLRPAEAYNMVPGRDPQNG